VSEYIYDPNWEQERARLAGLEDALDPGTIRVLTSIGVDEGWNCLEVGGGGGSITAWLCEQVGTSGRVIATDIDPRFLEAIEAPNLEIRRHDILNDALEADAFDLVHSRDLLEHLPGREQALGTMIAAVKPGGWIVVEDVDFAVSLYGNDDAFGFSPEIAPLFSKVWRGNTRMMRARGIEPEFGRRLPGLLLLHGLEDVDADVRARLMRGGSPLMALPRLAIQHLGPMLVDSGEVSQHEVDLLLETMEKDSSYGFAPLHVAAWGRKPGR